MKISIAAVKRKLKEGVEYTGEFTGTNSSRCVPNLSKTRRRIIANKSVMVSVFLDGPKVGEKIYLDWKDVTADERDGSIFLTMTSVSPPEEFMKITI
jgi:hypothetical protein